MGGGGIDVLITDIGDLEPGAQKGCTKYCMTDMGKIEICIFFTKLLSHSSAELLAQLCNMDVIDTSAIGAVGAVVLYW